VLKILQHDKIWRDNPLASNSGGGGTCPPVIYAHDTNTLPHLLRLLDNWAMRAIGGLLKQAPSCQCQGQGQDALIVCLVQG